MISARSVSLYRYGLAPVSVVNLYIQNSQGGSLMKFVSFISYFFAGAFLTNSVPHLDRKSVVWGKSVVVGGGRII